MPPKSAKSRHFSLSRQNSLKFCKDFTRDRIFFLTDIVCTFVRFCISGRWKVWFQQCLPHLVCFPCYKIIFVSQGSTKTYFVFTLNSIYHMFSELFHPVDLPCHIIFVKIGQTVTLCFCAPNKPTFLQNKFHVVMNNPIN